MDYKVIINSVSYNREEVKQLLIKELNCNEENASKYTRATPIEVTSYNSLEEAKQLKEKLENLGAYVEIQDGITRRSVKENIVVNNSIPKEESIFSIGKLLKALAVFTWVIGCIGGLINISSMGGIMGATLIVSSIIGGAIIYGLGEIVDTLQSIDKKLK